MATDHDPIHVRDSATDDPYADFDSAYPMGAPPRRFSRLALCVAAAVALTFGVMGTIAYGIWFDQDQQVYAQAIAGARAALGSPKPGEASAVSVAHEAEAPRARQAASADKREAANEHANDRAGWSGQIRQSPPVAGADPSVQLADTLPDSGSDVSADASADGLANGLANTSSGSSADTTAAAAASVAPSALPHTAKAADSAAQSASGHTARETRLAQQGRHASSNAKHKNSLFARVGSFFRRVSYRQHGNGRQQDIYSHP